MILVSVPEQTMHVYRNGVLIGRSTVSTGSKGHSTPGGVFSILEKKQTHRSKTYNNAPMPYMQRLTWTGIAMHSGALPGYPASHGCIRLPYDFSQLLFKATEKGGTVVVGDGKTPTPHLASNPGLLLAPKDFTPDMVRHLAEDEYDWRPERTTEGPITIIVSSADDALYVYRNGNPIGRGAVQVSGRGGLGNHVFTLLEGSTGKPSQLAPGREAGKWMRVTSQGRPVEADDIASRIRFNREFAQKLADEIKPGTTVIVTDQPVVRNPTADSTYFAAK
jgi:lipoprotein-anchoring transpeptidase ErfK/SrfK